MAKPMAKPMAYGSWENLKILGSGGFGQVSLWQNVKSKEKIAVKMCKQQLQERSLKRWQTEVEIMKKLDHPGIVKYHDVPTEIQDNYVRNYVALGMEYCEKGDLRKMLSEPENCCGLSEFQVRCLLNDIGSAISFLHKKHIIHRDLKPENIVMKHLDGGRLQYKIIDLGYAKDLNQYSCGTSFVGTLHYLAPEFFSPNLRYNETVDFWSFGLVAFECITGRRPFYPHIDAVQALPSLKAHKGDEHICTIQISESDFRYLSEIPRPHALNANLAARLEGWLQIMLRMEPTIRGMGESWYTQLQEILQEKHIQVFNTQCNEMISIPATASMKMPGLTEIIRKRTNTLESLLLFKNGVAPNPTVKAVDQCWKEPSPDGWTIYVYPLHQMYDAPQISLPSDVVRLNSEPRIKFNQREARNILNASTNFICNQGKVCSSSICSLQALVISIQKRCTYCNSEVGELMKSQFFFMGYLQPNQLSLHGDIEQYSKLEEEGLTDDDFDKVMNEWYLQRQELKEWRSVAEHAGELHNSVSADLSQANGLLKRANDFAEKTKLKLNDKVKVSHQMHNSIKLKIRNASQHHSEINQQANLVTELQETMKDYARKFVCPLKEFFVDTLKTIGEQTRNLLECHQKLQDRVPEVLQMKQNIHDCCTKMRDYQQTRQQQLWEIVYIANAVKADLCRQMSGLLAPQYRANVATEMDQNHAQFSQLVEEIVNDNPISDINMLEWGYLDGLDSQSGINQRVAAPIVAKDSASQATSEANQNFSNNVPQQSLEVSPEGSVDQPPTSGPRLNPKTVT
ncbi:unnamed protein product [Clavelina lepadiformis]|uniref:IkappaB kinase n=1 Tax=Clavelina lepadiformis TaxID=159417 RepID=A0ABP0GZM1_CLALP